ncbi:MAG: glycosyltransferase family 39 protein [Solirubrobacteraceae bacterium]
MNLLPQTASAPAQPPPEAGAPREPVGSRLRERLGSEGVALRLGGLATVMTVAAVMNTVKLAQNGYANIFYSAGVKSMLGSLHNFFFVSFDPAGLVTIDKPPLALWAQVLSAKVFGLSPLSVLLPEALMGVASVAVLYLILVRRFGVVAALIGGLALAVFPSFVAVSRANGVDPLLILLLLLACAAGIRACESGSWLALLGSAALVGLAFNTKTLAAYLVVPGIALAYFVCAPVSIRRRIAQLLLAGVVVAAVSFAWIAAVEATPASHRPYVGGSTDDTELGLTFGYNGFGRVEGQNGGPGQTVDKPGAEVPRSVQFRVERIRQAEHPLPAPPAVTFTHPRYTIGREKKPVAFGGPPGPLRLFGKGLGDQGSWYLPFAFIGLIAVLAMLFLEWRSPQPEDGARRITARRDPRLATTLALGGWLLVEALVLSTSKGIVHPYYISAIAPGAAAMVGAGAVALVALLRRRPPWVGLSLAFLAIVSTLVVEVVLSHRQHYMVSFDPVLLAGTALGLVAILVSALLRGSGAAIAIGAVLALLLVIPAGYSSTTWLAPVESTFPAAGPKQTSGYGGVGLDAGELAINRALMAYVRSHGGTRRFELLTVASDTGASMILLGMRVAAMGGYSGDDPALDGPQLARMVRNREARYVLLGGEYASRGGNLATKAVLASCREMVPREWHSPIAYPSGLTLFDCAGHERALAAAP